MPVAHQLDKLHEDDLQTVLAVQAQGVQRALESGDMAVVVCAPDVDHIVKAALFQLVAVVGNVGGKVSIEAVGPFQHVVLELKLVDLLLLFARLKQILAQNLRGAEPEGAVLLIGVAALGELCHRLGDIAALVQGAFKEPLVVLHAVAAQIGLHLRDVAVETEAGHGRVALGHILIEVHVAVLVIERFGEFLDVLALVAVLGELNRVLAQQ